MGLYRVFSCKGESHVQKLHLLPAYLFLLLEYGIYKLLVCNLTDEMPLGYIIVYLEFGVLKKFLFDLDPDMEQRILVVRNIEVYKFCTR